MPFLSDRTLRAALALPSPGPKGAACPHATVWYEVAAGLTAREVEAELTDHAIECAHCAPLLRTAFRDLDTGVAAPARKKIVTMPRAGWCIAAGVVGALFLGPTLWPHAQLYRAKYMLAKAEAVDRPNEFRFSDVPYAPARFNRSGPGQYVVPAALLQAGEFAAKASPSPETQLLKARIAVDSLDKQDHSAEIRQAMQQLGPSPKLFNDLGVAQASHWLATRNDADLHAALASFDKAVSLPEGRFNRALLLSHLDPANDLCKTVSDPDSHWDTDLKAHLHCK